MKSNINRLVLSVITLMMISLQPVQAQDSLQNKKISKEALIKKNIENRDFTFVPNSLMPLKGNFKALNYDYYVTVKHDSLIAYLPYFGEMHIAPPDPTGNSLDFTSTKFDYTVTEKKKGCWNIIIKPQDQKDTNDFTFTIYDNGTAYLDVSNMYRDPISYRGHLEDKK